MSPTPFLVNEPLLPHVSSGLATTYSSNKSGRAGGRFFDRVVVWSGLGSTCSCAFVDGLAVSAVRPSAPSLGSSLLSISSQSYLIHQPERAWLVVTARAHLILIPPYPTSSSSILRPRLWHAIRACSCHSMTHLPTQLQLPSPFTSSRALRSVPKVTTAYLCPPVSSLYHPFLSPFWSCPLGARTLYHS